MKFQDIIVIPPCYTYGDTLSVIGLVYFLTNYYNKVYLSIRNDWGDLDSYYKNYFKNDTKYEKNIFLVTDINNLLDNSNYGDFHIINTHTFDWQSAQFQYSDNLNIDKKHYFNDLNPIYNHLEIDDSYKCYPNKHLPPVDMSINHLFYYELVGLNNKVRMDFFHYERNLDEEKTIKINILNSNGLSENDKYNIINDPIGIGHLIHNYIGNNYKTININHIADNPGKVTYLLEGAESIHFIEGSNVNFFYHSQYKNIFKYDKKIYFHVWCRNRDWPHYKMDYAYRMMETPKLENWQFIFNEDELKKNIC